MANAKQTPAKTYVIGMRKKNKMSAAISSVLLSVSNKKLRLNEEPPYLELIRYGTCEWNDLSINIAPASSDFYTKDGSARRN